MFSKASSKKQRISHLLNDISPTQNKKNEIFISNLGPQRNKCMLECILKEGQFATPILKVSRTQKAEIQSQNLQRIQTKKVNRLLGKRPMPEKYLVEKQKNEDISGDANLFEAD